jgi:insulin receptor
MDIRNNVTALQRLSGCRVVEGFVRVVLIDRANESDYEEFTFPELHEITDYLLVYRVTGLTSLGKLFPNLSVIRGNSLFVDYALVVYEMFHLKVRKLFIDALLSSGDIIVTL